MYRLLVSFSPKGKFFDYKCIKGSKNNIENGKGFLGDIQGLKIIFLDSTEQIMHPDMAKRKLYDYWKINELGFFEKAE